jgi:hypothetical protein
MKNIAALFFVIILPACQLFVSQQASAEIIQPTGRDTTVSATFDISTPSQVDIWKNESGGSDPDNPALWRRNTWLCHSDSSPENGQCKTTVSWECYQKSTSIPLQFTENKTGAIVIINLTAYRQTGGYKNSVTDACTTSSGSETHANYYITPEELKKIPTGGTWKAELKVVLTQWAPNIKLADWYAHITINITDNNNQQIYLPEFGDAQPLIDLNLRPLPGTRGNHGVLHGSTTLDMCLYDGFNSESSQFTIQIKGAAIPGRSENAFSIYRTGGSITKDADTIDFF